MILVLKMKHGDYPVFARDDAERDRAYLHLFNLMNSHCHYDCGLDDDQLDLYEKAKQGDAKAARWLLSYRSEWHYVYEKIEKIQPIEP